MELRFTRDNILNTVLRDRCGRPLYRIESPWKVKNRITTISRIFPNPFSTSGDGDAPEEDAEGAAEGQENVRADNASDTDILLAGMEERVVAQILWQDRGQSIFTIDGRERKLNEYMPATSIFATKRVFVASDGKSYKWVIGKLGCRMESNEKDDNRHLVKLHRSVLAVIGKGRTPWLEVAEEVVPILDEVLTTFVWMERRFEGI
ncbi:hypothetical protein K488DRAFT_83474 [Vararia minispora EC-137]|uniref:Uncharacterized protein n=1 Tax=Vararia minispora EC-137 TaxID=1314806 RepID=A0ACB8QTK0_9AGAM|nr:hypothetical protein K488DRAFT_83474 [Vararia minispora EC-137]